MLRSLLIANRGEIASRIMRTARRLGIRTIAVYSAADARAPFVAQADAAVAIGGAPALESYLSTQKILAAAAASGAVAIHPGYGFLSENADFAEAVQAQGHIWVGPPAAAIRAMGLKDAAKLLMMRAQVPVTPGYLGEIQEAGSLKREAALIGYPILIKAVAGGGGKGMRRVEDPTGFDAALASCRREAAAAFGDDRVLLEKYIRAPRHIEVQIFGDNHGRVVHLFERDCSMQRRHQKVIEEAPAPGMDASTREFVCSIAVKAAQAVNYVGAGTVEFIADASEGLRADRIWFMEMNTRLQVEHPVTEAITGQDLVEWQLRVASGEALPCAQEALKIHGWAMEARLYAENPAAGFLPSTGPLRHLRMPQGIRIDSGIEEGGEITGFYDPMMAKLISHGADRHVAARRLSDACAAVQVWPVRTNAAFLARLTDDPAFLSANIDTSFIERHAESLVGALEPGDAIVRAAAGALVAVRPDGAWGQLAGFRVNGATRTEVHVDVGGHTFWVAGEPPAPHCTATVDGQQVLFWRGEAWPFGIPDSTGTARSTDVGDGDLRSPMPGRIVSVAVHQGEAVSKGQMMLAVEAMKMEHSLLAPFDGVVAELTARVGDQVAENTSLVRIEPVSAPRSRSG